MHPPVETPESTAAPRRVGRGTRILLWIIALLVMLAAAAFQRRTGPTYPVTGAVRWSGQELEFKLPTSHETSAGAPVVVPFPGDGPAGTLFWRRYPTDDTFAAVPLHVHDGEAIAELPVQLAAGKVEYYLEVTTPDGTDRIPAAPDETVILRFKDPVPLGVLLPHVCMMFLSMLVGVRAGLAALFRTGETRPLAWTTLSGLTLGGLILGPIAQEHAFGAYWTGVPFGWDLTDNKMLLMWLGWLVACLALGWRPAGRERAGRLSVVAAAIFMLVVFLIPHSLRGSRLDYEQLDKGASPEEAVLVG